MKEYTYAGMHIQCEVKTESLFRKKNAGAKELECVLKDYQSNRNDCLLTCLK